MLPSIPKDPLERFFYWTQERYQIHHLRQQGCPKPWSKDPVMQSVFFTNPYREMDRTTVWFREAYRDKWKDHKNVLFGTLAFRLFNLISTGNMLLEYNLLNSWQSHVCLKELRKLVAAKKQVFTGAYIIKLYNGMPKIEAAVDILSLVWRDREQLYLDLVDNNPKSHPMSLEVATSRLMQYPQMGPFMSYEVVCDLRYTHILENAPDKLTWANLGPGANRGLYRVFPTPMVSYARGETPKFPGALQKMRELLRLSKDYLPSKQWQVEGEPIIHSLKIGGRQVKAPRKTYIIPKMPVLEMREIEHSLCEFDKYERARLCDGNIKRNYQGVR